MEKQFAVRQIERIMEDHGHHSEETSYYISSRDACPRSLMELARERWKIESMHWMLDVTFSEDSCRLLSENARKTLNSLQKFALALHKRFLSASHKNSSIKASLLSALLRSEYLCDVLRFF
jgi:predicted transposase YbfD/YdcC